jgi:hypothetical protein
LKGEFNFLDKIRKVRAVLHIETLNKLVQENKNIFEDAMNTEFNKHFSEKRTNKDY